MSALFVVHGHVEMSEQLLADARRTEEAFRNPPPDWSPPDRDDLGEEWDD
jgi:hypothetical protein